MMSAKDHGGGREDNPYCKVCTNGRGELLSYDQVHKAMAEERFMKVNRMPRPGAEEAAHKALSQMPAWKSHRP
jgi:hypothetical protein